MANTFLGVLQNRNFLKLWIGLTSSQFAYNIVNFVIVLHIYDLTKSSTSISLVLIAASIPSIIFGPFSGILADKVDYQKIMFWTSVLRMLAVIVLIFSKNNVLGLLEIVFLISTISQFFSPASSASIPLIVKEKKLVAANSMMVTTTYATMLLGYSVAGPLMGLLTTKGALLFSAFLYLVAVYAINSMKKYDHKTGSKTSLTKISYGVEHIWSQLKDSVIHLTKNHDLYLPIIRLTLSWAMLGAFIVLIPAFAEKEIGLSTRQVGPYIVAPAGIGMIIGAYVLDKKKRFLYNLATNIGFSLAGLSLLLLALYRYYKEIPSALLIAVVLMISMGVFSSVVYISSQTMLHIKADSHIRGRIFGISSMLMSVAMSMPAIFAGGISDLTSPMVSFIFLSVAVLAYGLVGFFRVRGNELFIGSKNVSG